MVADLLKVAVEGCALLLSMYGVFSGIDIDYESPLVPASK
jgi:GH18 family chitinase